MDPSALAACVSRRLASPKPREGGSRTKPRRSGPQLTTMRTTRANPKSETRTKSDSPPLNNHAPKPQPVVAPARPPTNLGTISAPLFALFLRHFAPSWRDRFCCTVAAQRLTIRNCAIQRYPTLPLLLLLFISSPSSVIHYPRRADLPRQSETTAGTSRRREPGEGGHHPHYS